MLVHAKPCYVIEVKTENHCFQNIIPFTYRENMYSTKNKSFCYHVFFHNVKQQHCTFLQPQCCQTQSFRLASYLHQCINEVINVRVRDISDKMCFLCFSSVLEEPRTVSRSPVGLTATLQRIRPSKNCALC